MKRLCLALSVLAFWGCGPSYGGQDVKTPDQLIDEQEQLGAQEEAAKKARHDDTNYAEETDAEKKREFDEKQAKMELTRATRSAESCPGVVAEQETKDHPRGEAHVTITFQEDGSAKTVTIPSPFDGTPIGDCVTRAYKAVIVPPFTGGEHIMDWDLTLKDEPKAGKTAKKK
jgi:hypothetical protein